MQSTSCETKTELLDTLAINNRHPRDDKIVFDEPTHKYTIINESNVRYTSVTTWLHHHFAQFDADKVIKSMMSKPSWNASNKYWGLSAEQIKAQWNANGQKESSAGTNMHYEIECFMNRGGKTHIQLYDEYMTHHSAEAIAEMPAEWRYFLQFVKTTPELLPYRTEWSIFDEELKLAGQIDMVYFNQDDGSVSIYDWKRAKNITMDSYNKYAITESIAHIPDSNYWHYSLQLNTYKAILERKYGLKVRDLYLVRLHPNNEYETFEIIKCANMAGEVAVLFEEREEYVRKHSQIVDEPAVKAVDETDTI